MVATCGIIYELVAGTLASYLLGDSVTQFSTIIGSYLFAMGVGSWFSKFLKGNLLAWFVRIEILVGIVGGSSAAIPVHTLRTGSLLPCFIILAGFIDWHSCWTGASVADENIERPA